MAVEVEASLGMVVVQRAAAAELAAPKGVEAARVAEAVAAASLRVHQVDMTEAGEAAWAVEAIQEVKEGAPMEAEMEAAAEAGGTWAEEGVTEAGAGAAMVAGLEWRQGPLRSAVAHQPQTPRSSQLGREVVAWAAAGMRAAVRAAARAGVATAVGLEEAKEAVEKAVGMEAVARVVAREVAVEEARVEAAREAAREVEKVEAESVAAVKVEVETVVVAEEGGRGEGVVAARAVVEGEAAQGSLVARMAAERGEEAKVGEVVMVEGALVVVETEMVVTAEEVTAAAAMA